MIIGRESLEKIKITPVLDSLRLEKIDDSEYFSEKYGGYISNSRLSLINPEQDGSPEIFFEGLGKHSIFSTSLDIGSAVHELCLQKDLFHLCFEADRPTAKAGAMADILYKDFLSNNITTESVLEASDKVDYYKGKMNQDRIDVLLAKCGPYWRDRKKYEENLKLTSTSIYLDSRSRNTVQECVNAISKNQAIQTLLHPKGLISDPISENEQAILLDIEVEVPDYEPFTLRLKSKLDNYTIDQESNVITVNDIKTIGKILSEFNSEGGSIDRYHYRRELGMYMYLLQLCAKKYYNIDNPTCKGNFLVVSTIPQYYTKVVPMSKKDFITGFSEFKYLLKLVAYYCSKGYRFG